VAIIDLRQLDIDGVLEEIRSFGVKTLGYPLDVRDGGAKKKAADQFIKDLGSVDGPFACAGISRTSPAEKWTSLIPRT
jgi:NAD(P)-dependent dehydrogenase (short-subunit alcohol dehydrogenase family)